MNVANYLRPAGSSGRESEEPNPNLQAIGRLASGVAHDFNNLLTGIILYCDLMLEEIARPGHRTPDRERLRHAADEIRTACERGTALIQQLMVVVRPPASEPDSVSWNETILGMSNLLRRLIGENIEIIPDLADDLKCVCLSPSRAQQVVLNLVLNARDAMPQGGKIVLQTKNHSAVRNRNRRNFVEFSVTDTGCGMDSATLVRAFEPFFTTKPPGKGTGLGLATVQGIIDKAGGQIEVESHTGRGTCALVRLPRAPRGQPVVARPIPSRQIASRTQKRPPQSQRKVSLISSPTSSRRHFS